MLQKNERLVLQHLVDNARTTDSAIAQEIGISTQAVGKIRRKLELSKVIRGYHVELDPNMVGLHVVNVLAIAVAPEIMRTQKAFEERLRREPCLAGFIRLIHGGANYLLFYTFGTLQESERHFAEFTRTLPGVTIINLQTTTWDVMLKNTMHDAYIALLRDGQEGNSLLDKKRAR